MQEDCSRTDACSGITFPITGRGKTLQTKKLIIFVPAHWDGYALMFWHFTYKSFLIDREAWQTSSH
jgi:hypothetical protein